jgi:hypothetical protein
MIKYFYVAVTVCESGKYYSYAVKVTQSDNVLSKLAIKNIVTANICPTKKYAVDLVRKWNECYRTNGTYMFDTMPDGSPAPF